MSRCCGFVLLWLVLCAATRGASPSRELALSAGDALTGFLDQRTTDLAIVVSGPDGREIRTFDSFEHGREPVCLIATVSGTYKVTVRTKQGSAQPGPDALSTTGIRPATEIDVETCKAVGLATEAKQLAGQP